MQSKSQENKKDLQAYTSQTKPAYQLQIGMSVDLNH